MRSVERQGVEHDIPTHLGERFIYFLPKLNQILDRCSKRDDGGRYRQWIHESLLKGKDSVEERRCIRRCLRKQRAACESVEQGGCMCSYVDLDRTSGV